MTPTFTAADGTTPRVFILDANCLLQARGRIAAGDAPALAALKLLREDADKATKAAKANWRWELLTPDARSGKP